MKPPVRRGPNCKRRYAALCKVRRGEYSDTRRRAGPDDRRASRPSCRARSQGSLGTAPEGNRAARHRGWRGSTVGAGRGPTPVSFISRLVTRKGAFDRLCLSSSLPLPISAPALQKRPATRVVRIAPNRAAAPRDSRFDQNERLGDSAIRRFGDCVIPSITGCRSDRAVPGRA